MRIRKRQTGTTLLETLSALAVGAVLLSVTVPSLVVMYGKHRLASTASTIQGMVRQARLKALKEKTDHRVVFHDQGAITPNRVDLEEDQDGSFVALASFGYALPQGVKILGSGLTNSVDEVGVTRRGRCDSGSVFLSGTDGGLEVVAIKTSCAVSLH